MDREAWQATVHGVTKGWTLVSHTHTHRRLGIGYLLKVPPGNSHDQSRLRDSGLKAVISENREQLFKNHKIYITTVTKTNYLQGKFTPNPVALAQQPSLTLCLHTAIFWHHLMHCDEAAISLLFFKFPFIINILLMSLPKEAVQGEGKGSLAFLSVGFEVKAGLKPQIFHLQTVNLQQTPTHA